MIGAWKLGTFQGIEVRLHWTFALLLLWVAWQHIAQGHGASTATLGVALLIAVFACVVLHEFGHALTARRFGVGTKDITLYPFGGIASLERIPEEPAQEAWIAVAGPAVNMAIAGFLGAVLVLFGDPAELAPVPKVGAGLVSNLLVINIALAVFNLVPAFPMDGGRVLRSLLALRMDRVRATRVAATVGQGFAMFLGFLGLFANWFLLFIALFVYLGAEQEARAVETRGAMRGSKVRDAMVRRVQQISADAPLRVAMEELIAGEIQDFPVVDAGGSHVGMLSREALIRALAAGKVDAPIHDLVQAVAPIGPEEPLEDAAARLQSEQLATLPVVDGDVLVGLVTLQNLAEWMAIHSALDQAAAHR